MANKFLASKLYHDIDHQIQSFYFLLRDKKPNQNYRTNNANIRKDFLKEKAWPLTLKLLLKFRQQVEKNGAKFLIVDGHPITADSSGGYTNKDFEAFCKLNTITYIPMYKEYLQLKSSKQKSEYFLKDGHPTSRGNEILSQLLAEKFLNYYPVRIIYKGF
jgi:hypothetical protein